MPAKYFSVFRNCVISFFAKKVNTLLDAFRTNSRNIIGRNPSMVTPLLANQDLTPMLTEVTSCLNIEGCVFGMTQQMRLKQPILNWMSKAGSSQK